MVGTYYESCPECDSLDIRVLEDRLEFVLVSCNECGYEWEDWDDAEWDQWNSLRGRPHPYQAM